MGVDTHGVHAGYTGFTATSTLTTADYGKPVKIYGANDTVALCSDGDDFIGILRHLEFDADDNATLATVQTRGFVNGIAYSGSGALNMQPLVAGAAGVIKIATGETAFEHKLYAVTSYTSGESGGVLDFDLG